MNGGTRASARWIIAVLAGALVASGVVVFALVRITAPGPGGASVETSTETGASPSQASSAVSATGALAVPTVSDSPTSSSADNTHDEPSGVSGSGGFAATKSVPSTTSITLPSSRIEIPAAWSGFAKVTVSVRGQCAGTNPSVYADLPADLAVDLVQNEAAAAEVPLPPGINPKDPALTLGVNPNGVPSIALYSSQVDESGMLQRFWSLRLSASDGRTAVHGTLVAQPTDASTPNMMVDAETSLQPCEAASTVSLPRALANGATIDGWLSTTEASLTVHGTTTDGKRTVTAVIEATRAR